MKINGEQAFSIPTSAFAVSASNEGYVLNYSADGETFTPWEKSTPSNEVLIVTNFPKHLTYKLMGNGTEVYIQY